MFWTLVFWERKLKRNFWGIFIRAQILHLHFKPQIFFFLVQTCAFVSFTPSITTSSKLARLAPIRLGSSEPNQEATKLRLSRFRQDPPLTIASKMAPNWVRVRLVLVRFTSSRLTTTCASVLASMWVRLVLVRWSNLKLVRGEPLIRFWDCLSEILHRRSYRETIANWALTFSWMPFGPLDFVLRAFSI